VVNLVLLVCLKLLLFGLELGNSGHLFHFRLLLLELLSLLLSLGLILVFLLRLSISSSCGVLGRGCSCGGSSDGFFVLSFLGSGSFLSVLHDLLRLMLSFAPLSLGIVLQVSKLADLFADGLLGQLLSIPHSVSLHIVRSLHASAVLLAVHRMQAHATHTLVAHVSHVMAHAHMVAHA